MQCRLFCNPAESHTLALCGVSYGALERNSSYLPHYIKPRGEDTLVLGGAAPHPR
jgi:hypothetical protein